LLPLSTAHCNGSTLLYVCIAFFHFLPPPFTFRFLGLGTPSSSARVIILSMLVSDLKDRTV
jgi:hypothetical protein